jgi:hypothetical protein
MCDVRILNWQKIQHSLATRVPKIVLHRVEEIIPSLTESVVSILCLCVQKIILLSDAQDLCVKRKYFFYFIPYSLELFNFY